LTLVVFLAGCGTALQETKTEVPQGTAPKPSAKTGMPNARYYDFEDVQIPNELSLNADRSKIFQTPNVTAGVISLDGNVEINSLIAFFRGAMAKDNWQMKGSFKLPPKYALLFEKKNKRAIVTIEESTFSTKVDIWMIPVSAEEAK
jgi:hypothetical protein